MNEPRPVVPRLLQKRNRASQPLMPDYAWLYSSNLGRLLALLDPDCDPRKVRLLACALARRVWDHLDRPALRAAVETAERVADYRAGKQELKTASAAVAALVEEVRQSALQDKRSLPEYWCNDPDHIYWMEWQVRLKGSDAAAARPLFQAATLAQLLTRPTIFLDTVSTIADAARRLVGHPSEESAQCDLLRDLFTGPFRSAAFSPDWRTDTAISLARVMYDAREFSAMPILADALQDAGCDNDDILTHCRDTALTHVRGCWVCDLVLGKE